MSPARPGSVVPRVNVLGVGVSVLTLQQALEAIDRWVADGGAHYVCVTSVNGVMESQRDEFLRSIHNRADMVTADGMPLVWWSRLMGHRRAERVYGPDLMLGCCQGRRFRHYLYGGAAGVAERLADALTHRFPGLEIVGVESPPFRSLTPSEEGAAIQRINAARPDIVWVGLGAPKQERWMYAHVGRITAPVMIGVGAAFDYHSRVKHQAPGWMQRSGLEWSFRLFAEPRRLWRRYLVNNPLFIVKALQQALGLRVYVLDCDEPDGATDARRAAAYSRRES